MDTRRCGRLSSRSTGLPGGERAGYCDVLGRAIVTVLAAGLRSPLIGGAHMPSAPLMLSCSVTQAPIHLAVAPPFAGSRDFLRRLYAEQFCKFRRFLFADHWYASLEARNRNG